MSYQRLVGFGEAMLRLTPPEGTPVEAASTFNASVGGAELNGCIAAARSGMPATRVSALRVLTADGEERRSAQVGVVDPVGAGDALFGTFLAALPVPGVATATEVLTARMAGAEVLKLFPAGPLGTDYLRTLRGQFPDAAFLPTGGIAASDVQAWLDAGALCVGLGGTLTDPGGIDARLGALLEGAR